MTEATASTETETVKLTPRERLALRIVKAEAALQRAVDALGTPTTDQLGLHNGLAAAVDGIAVARAAAALLLPTWKPVRPKTVRAKLALTGGEKVNIRKSARKQYEGMVPAEQMVGLVVVKSAARFAQCRTASGEVGMFQVAHLELAK